MILWLWFPHHSVVCGKPSLACGTLVFLTNCLEAGSHRGLGLVLGLGLGLGLGLQCLGHEEQPVESDVL